MKAQPTWPGKWLNIFGDPGSGKTHLAKILEKKINKTRLVDAKNIKNNLIQEMSDLDCLIIDRYENNIEENSCILFLNQSRQFRELCPYKFN